MHFANAIILCAGRGTRYAGKGKEIPKCLLRLGKELRILDTQVHLLAAFGISDITVIVGNHPNYTEIKDQIINYVNNSYAGMIKIHVVPMQFPKNQFPEVAYTLLNIKHLLSNSIILLGDTYFTIDAFREIINEPFDDVMFIRSKVGRPEVYAILTKDGIKQDWSNYKYNTFKLKDLIQIINPKVFKPNGFIHDIDYQDDYLTVRKYAHDEELIE